jgi:hypothetical protein
VRNAHRRRGFVDVLPARARRPIGVNLDVVRVNRNLGRLVNLRHDFNGRETRLPLAVGVERRDANQTMHAMLAAQHPVGVRAVNEHGRERDAGHLAGQLVMDLGPEPVPLAQRRYCRSSMAAQSHASVPPAPGFSSRIALCRS